jgi:hypothetical protein
MNRKARRAAAKGARAGRLRTDAEIEIWTSSPAYKERARKWLADFQEAGAALSHEEAARSFAKATGIDVALAGGILRRVADPQGYANFIARRRAN